MPETWGDDGRSVPGRYMLSAVDSRPLTGDTPRWYFPYETPANEYFTVGASDTDGT
jgi:hypothetical protein